MNGTIPGRNCDVVMKGGVTSGVVYPLAITELAEEFRFKNIGGTSAGAIAAAMTAAAEYRRVSSGGDGTGFEELKKLPKFLGGKTDDEPNLLNLFPPVKRTRRLFRVLAPFLEDGTTGEKIMTAFAALLVVSPLITLASFAPAALLIFALNRLASLDFATIAMLAIVALVLAATGVLALVLGNVAQALFVTLPKNRFGFSTGKKPADRSLPGVTDWLHAEIQKAAGRTGGAPLTFGDLWLAGGTNQTFEECEKNSGLRSINLQMMTTALTHGHPYRLPFENRLFAFRPSELRDYFPDDVVDHMIAKARKDRLVDAASDPDLCALPEPWDLPIVVAARMSLSFPLLFSMVPLYAVDHSRKMNHGDVKTFERCWFVDGGVSSNFPISLFDSPFPRWPTFGINLVGFHPDYEKSPDERENIRMADGAGRGVLPHWTRFPDSGPAAIVGYIGALLDAMRNWVDNTQSRVIGFRDRIVHIKLDSNEGGLHLNMDDRKVGSLTERGQWAGRKLRERFGEKGAAQEMNWNTHRWTRLRTYLALLQKSLVQMDGALAYDDPAYPDYKTLLARTHNEDPDTGAYWWPHHAAYQAATQDVLNLAAKMHAPDFHEGITPGQLPELRVRPKI